MKNALLIITAVYIFGILVSLPLIYDVFTTDFLWFESNPVPIFTADAGLHGFYAKSLLAGVTYPFGAEYFLGYVILAVVAVTGLSIDWVMLFLPIIVAPLLVVPLILFSKTLNDLRLGVIASLFAVSFNYFYGRVSLGFTDTDMFTLFFPLVAVLFMVLTIMHQRMIFAFFAGLTLLIFANVYHSSASINVLLLGTFALYSIVFMYKERFVYLAFAVMSVSVLPLDFFIVLSGLMILWGLCEFTYKKTEIPYYYFIGLFSLVIATLPFVIDVSHFYSRALAYFDKQEYYTIVGMYGTYFFQHGLKTVAETTLFDIGNMFLTINISKVLILFSTVGFILLLRKEKLYWFLVPFAFLGVLGFFAGNRFSFFYTPVYGIGLAYLVILVSSMLYRHYKVERMTVYFAFIILLFHILYILEMNKGSYVRMLAYGEEKAALEKLSVQLTPDDKIVTWWDFGWPLWYFTGYKNTLADNGAHGGPDSYMMSKILTESNQTFVANAVKYFANNKDIARKERYGYVIAYLASKYDLQELFSSFYIRNDIKAEQDTYIILHRNMVTIFNTIVGFSDFDYTNVDRERKQEFQFRFFPYNYPKDINQTFLEAHSKMKIAGKSELVNSISFTKDQKLTQKYQFDTNSTHYVIFDNHETAYMTDENVYNSFLFQALLLDNYDRDLFEKVDETYLIKIFKVK